MENTTLIDVRSQSIVLDRVDDQRVDQVLISANEIIVACDLEGTGAVRG